MGIGQHARSALWLGAGVWLFIICLSAGFVLFRTTAEMNAKIYTWIGATDNNQQSILTTESEYTCTGAEVIQTIYRIKELDVDIEVNGQRWDSSIDPNELELSNINIQHTYRPTYVRNTKGQLILLKYDLN